MNSTEEIEFITSRLKTDYQYKLEKVKKEGLPQDASLLQTTETLVIYHEKERKFVGLKKGNYIFEIVKQK